MAIYSETFNKLMANEDFVKEMLAKETAEDVQKIFAENGVELTLEEVDEVAKNIFATETEGELDEAALEDVAGGVVITAATGWAIAKATIAVGGAALGIYKWYKSR